MKNLFKQICIYSFVLEMGMMALSADVQFRTDVSGQGQGYVPQQHGPAYYNYYVGQPNYGGYAGYPAQQPMNSAIYQYGLYGSYPPPTPNQAFPDQAQDDALYHYLQTR